MDGLDDAVLIREMAQGDDDAAVLLMRRYRDRLRRLMWSHGVAVDDLDDLVQEVWMRVWASADAYDSRQPFWNWLARIAVNRIHSAGARMGAEADAIESVKTTDLLRWLDTTHGHAPAADTLLEASQREEEIRAGLDDLPPALAEAMRLRFYEGLSDTEIAERLGIPRGTVNSRHYHAIRRLRELLEGKRDE
jgi:RNA polymerase sigma-70 factor (ECF subfamily)